jgi:hypothetical protein
VRHGQVVYLPAEPHAHGSGHRNGHVHGHHAPRK